MRESIDFPPSPLFFVVAKRPLIVAAALMFLISKNSYVKVCERVCVCDFLLFTQ